MEGMCVAREMHDYGSFDMYFDLNSVRGRNHRNKCEQKMKSTKTVRENNI